MVQEYFSRSGPPAPEAAREILQQPTNPEALNVAKRLQFAADLPEPEGLIDTQITKLAESQRIPTMEYFQKVQNRYAAIIAEAQPQALEATAHQLNTSPTTQRIIDSVIKRLNRNQEKGKSYLTSNGNVDIRTAKADLRLLEGLPIHPGTPEHALVIRLRNILTDILDADAPSRLLSQNRDLSPGDKAMRVLLMGIAVGLALMTGLISKQKKNTSIIPFLMLGLAAMAGGSMVFKGREQQYVDQVSFLATERFRKLSHKAGMQGANGEAVTELLLQENVQKLASQRARQKITDEQFRKDIGIEGPIVERLLAMTPVELANLTNMLYLAKDTEAKEAVRYYVKNDMGPQNLKDLPLIA